MTDQSKSEVSTDGDQNEKTSTAPETDLTVDLASIPSLSTLVDGFAALTDERFTDLLRAGVRYPLTYDRPFETTLVGGILLSLVVTFVPANGHFIRIIEQTAAGSDESPSFPGLRNWKRWMDLTVIGFKGLIIALLCFLTPLATLFGMLQVVSESTGGLLSQPSTMYARLLVAVVLLYFYPAAIGNFVEKGRLIRGIGSVDGSSILWDSEYARSVLATATLFALAGCVIWVTWTLWGVAVVAIAGPTLFFCLSATSAVIGASRRAIHLRADPDPNDPSASLQADESPASRRRKALAVQTDPIREALGEDTQRDLYELSSWEVRTRIDKMAARVYDSLRTDYRIWVALYVIGLLVVQTSGWLEVLYQRPRLILRISLATFPSLLLTGYLWHRYGITRIRSKTAIITFGLAASLTIGAQAVTGIYGFYDWYGEALVLSLLLAYFVYAASSELSKWLAVRLYAYRSGEFDAVADGAIYGAIAGLAALSLNNIGFFATQVQVPPLIVGEISPNRVIHALIVEPDAATGQIYMRAITGTAHVIASAFAGYYLGLAKFDRENAGQITAKGLLLAVFVLGTGEAISLAWYHGVLPWLSPQYIELSPTQVDLVPMLFVVAYLGGFCVLLFRKLSRYRTVFREVSSPSSREETTERVSPEVIERQLEYLDELREYGTLSDEEWRQKRQQIRKES